MGQTNNTPLILIVEDKIENLQLIGNILKEYRKAIATTGIDAIRIAKELHPDLILLDLMLPDMDGYEVCETLQSNSYTNDIPVIFVSALSQKENLVKGFKMGGVDYVTKPFDPDELIARVKTHLDLKHSKELIVIQNENLHLC